MRRIRTAVPINPLKEAFVPEDVFVRCLSEACGQGEGSHLHPATVTIKGKSGEIVDPASVLRYRTCVSKVLHGYEIEKEVTVCLHSTTHDHSHSGRPFGIESCL